MFDRRILQTLAHRWDSYYLYDESAIVAAAGQLKAHFEGVEFLYSLKTNPFPPVVDCIFAQGLGADAASLAEVRQAAAAGLAPAKIHFSAPGKTDRDIDGALGLSTIIADSPRELARISRLAKERGITATIGLRVNPDFSFAGPGGVPSKFGIDEAQLLAALPQWQAYDGLDIAGIHVHLRSQELSAHVLAAYYENMLGLALRVQETLGRPLDFINMGSGLGIPYGQGDAPLDTVRLGQQLAGLAKAFSQQLPATRLVVETGRYVVGKSGVYVTRVLDKKVSHGKTFVILCNTLNGFIRPSLAVMAQKFGGSGPLPGYEPLFTQADAFQFTALSDASETETVTLTGNLCTFTDLVAEDVTLPVLEAGDLIMISNAGSYGAALSPMEFSSQPTPAQLLLRRDGTLVGAQGQDQNLSTISQHTVLGEGL